VSKSYSIGKMDGMWGSDESGNIAQTITFVVTEDCNLRCKYCYITHKSSKKQMPILVAKKFIDYVLSDKIERPEAVIIEFIGGEPLLEVSLIDEIVDYFKAETYKKGISWYWNYRINICSNGVNYRNKEVQDFLFKNRNKMSMSITIDGTKEKHDSQRVFPDGTGSFDVVSESVDLWVTQFKPHTKVTFASEDLVYLKDSIVELWSRGIKMIGANVVFEDVWKEGDDRIFESQLKELADYIIENELYNKGYYCTLFSDTIGEPYTDEDLRMTSCGAGSMLALGPEGKIYPCIRYKDYSLNNKEEWVIGTIQDGINKEKVRAFDALMFKVQSDQECLSCPVARGCSFCQGFNYDVAVTPTNFQRAKYICKMHKARVRANNYYWAKVFNLKGIERETYKNETRKMYFILGDKFVDFCTLSHEHKANTLPTTMKKEEIITGLRFAMENFYKPVFLHGAGEEDMSFLDDFPEYRILHIFNANDASEAQKYKEHILVFDETTFEMDIKGEDSIILNVHSKNIHNLALIVQRMFEKTARVNLNIQDINADFDFKTYEFELRKILEGIIAYGKKSTKEINVITDLSYIESHDGCNAGNTSIAYGPDGRFYCCPLEFGDPKKSCGDCASGLKIQNQHLLTLDYQPLCQECVNYHCDRCQLQNKLTTNEVNVPPSYKCKKAMIERSISEEYYNTIGKSFFAIKEFKKANYDDPIELLQNKAQISHGYRVLC